MSTQGTVGVVLGGLLVLFGLGTALYQARERRRLAARTHVPSDEFQYLRRRYFRRLLTGVAIAVIGGMLAAAYLSGMEQQLDKLGESAEATEPPPPPDQPKVLTPEQKQLMRQWGVYWGCVLVLLFVVFGLSFADAWATRRYALSQFKHIRDDHQTKLRRDLAVYRAQKMADREKKLGTGDAPPDDGSGEQPQSS